MFDRKRCTIVWANWSKVKEGTASFNLFTQRAAGENLGKQSRHNSKALSKGMPEIPKRIFVTATYQSTTSSLSLFPLKIPIALIHSEHVFAYITETLRVAIG